MLVNARFLIIFMMTQLTLLWSEPNIPIFSRTWDAGIKNEAVLKIEKTGRYRLTVISEQGTRIDLIDRMAGRLVSAGKVGEQDGQIDLILDAGEYKIKAVSAPRASGQVFLKVYEFSEADPKQSYEEKPFLQPLRMMTGKLTDLKKLSYWIHIKDRRHLQLEIIGRNLKDARLWKDGTWLMDISPKISEYEPEAGRPMTLVEFFHDINPGLYLLQCYGGVKKKWANEKNINPLYVRMGIPTIGQNGQKQVRIGPFGRESFLIDRKTNFFQLSRNNKIKSFIRVGSWKKGRSRYTQYRYSAKINKKSRNPACVIRGYGYSGIRLLTVEGSPGDRMRLDYFINRKRINLSSGKYWISSLHSVEGLDAIDVTAMLTHPRLKKPVRGEVIAIDKAPFIRKINLIDQFSVFLFIKKAGRYQIREDKSTGAVGGYQFKPFMTRYPAKFKAPAFTRGGSTVDLLSGYYVLTVKPWKKGILSFSISRENEMQWLRVPYGMNRTGMPDRKEALLWPRIILDRASSRYQLNLNHRGGVDNGIIVRHLPVDMQTPLPFFLNPGESFETDIFIPKPSSIRVVGNPYRVKIDGKTVSGKQPITRGNHRLFFKNTGKKNGFYEIAIQALDRDQPPKRIVHSLKQVFSELLLDKEIYCDFKRKEKKYFLLNIKKPGLYRLESSGRLATEINIRTPSTISLFKAATNGVGRNGLIQQYIKEGQYLVSVGSLGKSQGRAGIHLSFMKMAKVENLQENRFSRSTVQAGYAKKYRIQIPKTDRYQIESYSIGKKLLNRLEDERGWPLLNPGFDRSFEILLKKGEYFYYTLPLAIQSRRLTRFSRVIDTGRLEGKGPFDIRINSEIHHVWTESEGRKPDLFRFNMTAPADINMQINREMQVDILNKSGEPIGKTVGGIFNGKLSYGEYILQVRSIEKNNRVPYRLVVTTRDIMPFVPLKIKRLPASRTIRIHTDCFIDLSTYGDSDVRGILMDHNGHIIAQNDDRENDWNLKISRFLKAGNYHLKLMPVDKMNDEIQVLMTVRTKKKVEVNGFPFKIRQVIGDAVIEIPFNRGKKTGLPLFSMGAVAGNEFEMALVSDDRTIARGSNRIAIPLIQDKHYRLLVWRKGDARILENSLSIQAELKPVHEINLTMANRKYNLKQDQVVQLKNNLRMSYQITSPKAGGNLFISQYPDQPCNPVIRTTSDCTQQHIYLLSRKNMEIELQPLRIRAGEFKYISIDNGRIALDIDSSKAPLLLKVQSTGLMMGINGYDIRKNSTSEYSWIGSYYSESLSWLPIPKDGKYRVMVWNGKTINARSRQYRNGSIGEEIKIAAIPFPEQESIIIKSGIKTQYSIEAGKSIKFSTNGNSGYVKLILSNGLIAFQWKNGLPFNLIHSPVSDTVLRSGKFKLSGDTLFIVNNAKERGMFKISYVENATGMDPEITVLKPFDMRTESSGEIVGLIEKRNTSDKLFILGIPSPNGIRLYKHNGGIVDGKIFRQDVPIRMFDPVPGMLKLKYKRGYLKVWIGDIKSVKSGIFGPFKMMKPMVKGNTQSLEMTDKSGYHAFTLAQPRFVLFRSDTSVLAAITGPNPNNGHIYKMSRLKKGKKLFIGLYLKPGNYHFIAKKLDDSTRTIQFRMKQIEVTKLEPGIMKIPRMIDGSSLHVYRVQVKKKADIGLGIRSEQSGLKGSLYDLESNRVASGDYIYTKLEPGNYIFTVHSPGKTASYQIILLGSEGSQRGIPEQIRESYFKGE